MKKIKLTKNKFAIVDNEDYEWLKHLEWQYHSAGYAICNHLLMHRLILKPNRAQDIDHIDGNRLNNQKSNLRIAPKFHNHWNRKKRANTSSQFKGVCWSKRDKKWTARIIYKGKRICLGNFLDEYDAAKAYDLQAKKLFGKFARLNFNGNK